ncbi:MAG: DUF72 domain-containing protein [Gemmatimonadetes bacterium]|nr:DUF72 domain-containing protein [Gemmatimonadota bacterium]
MTEPAGTQRPPIPRVRLGTMGWNYAAWVGPLYPSGTPSREMLKLYARAFDTVEVDSTWYAVPAANTVRGWLDRTPDHFVFSLKMPREITHDRRLHGSDSVLADFIDRARELGPRLGPVLIQLGPDFSTDERPALERFLTLLPADVRFAVEFRQPGWICEETHELLTAHRVALAISDGRFIPRDWSLALVRRPTTDFHYLRWLGDTRELTDHSHLQIDRTADLQEWASAIRAVPGEAFSIYGYYNNHYSGHSPATAHAMLKLLGQNPVAPDQVGDQISLF